jgi:hypothetical protein
MLALVFAVLTVAPWKGQDPPTATEAQGKYRVTVSGTPGTVVRITTTGVAKGWIAAFCDRHICSPNRTRETIPAGGHVDVQLELIRDDVDAAKRSGVTLHGSDGSVVTIPPV